MRCRTGTTATVQLMPPRETNRSLQPDEGLVDPAAGQRALIGLASFIPSSPRDDVVELLPHDWRPSEMRTRALVLQSARSGRQSGPALTCMALGPPVQPATITAADFVTNTNGTVGLQGARSGQDPEFLVQSLHLGATVYPAAYGAWSTGVSGAARHARQSIARTLSGGDAHLP